MTADQLAKLKWQCRRGTKELDQLLMGFIDQHYLALTPFEKNLFIDLLNQQDSLLIGLFFSDKTSESNALQQLVKKIRNTTV